MNKREKVKYNTFQNILYIFKEIWKIDKFVIFILLLDSISGGLIAFPLMFLPKIVLDGISENKSLPAIAANITLLIFIHFLLSFVKRQTSVRSFTRCIAVRMDFIAKYGEKAMTMDFEHLEDSDVLDIAARAQRCMYNPQMGIQGMIHNVQRLLTDIIIFAGCFYVISSVSGWMILITVLLAYINFFIVRINGLKQKKIWDKMEFILRRLNYINEVMKKFSIGKDIRLFNMSGWIKDKYMESLEQQHEGVKEAYSTDFKFTNGLTLTMFIEQTALYIFLIARVISGLITVGDFSLYSGAVSTFSGNADNILNIIADMGRKNAEICDYRKFLEYPDKVITDKPQDIVIDENGKYTVEFKNVSFKYPHKDEYALKNINLRIEPGQKLSVVGFNGADKSTFIKLLCRLYAPSEGEILMNGVNINRFSKADYFKMFSVVFQDIYAFAFSVYENISMAAYDETDTDECIRVSETAGLHDKIKSLPGKYHTSLLRVIDDDGLELSGGETQKLALARALYKNAPFIILDEPTSALDALAERELYEKFNELSHGRSAVYISHRLASAKFWMLSQYSTEGIWFNTAVTRN
jgi:ATP-binding cassette subfamily C protein